MRWLHPSICQSWLFQKLFSSYWHKIGQVVFISGSLAAVLFLCLWLFLSSRAKSLIWRAHWTVTNTVRGTSVPCNIVCRFSIQLLYLRREWECACISLQPDIAVEMWNTQKFHFISLCSVTRRSSRVACRASLCAHRSTARQQRNFIASRNEQWTIRFGNCAVSEERATRERY